MSTEFQEDPFLNYRVVGTSFIRPDIINPIPVGLILSSIG